MALDFIIENNKTYEKEYLPLGVETHWGIYSLAKDNDLPLISRLSDYYSDNLFKAEEIESLLIEIDKLLKVAQVDSQVQFLQELRRLAVSAKDQKENIIVRAD